MFKILLGLFFSFFFTGNSPVNTKTKNYTYTFVRITIKNKLKRLVYVAVQYLPYNRETDSDEDWQKKAWYKLKAGESITLDTKNSYFYYYAESKPDFFGTKLYWKGKTYFLIDGESYGFKEVYIDSYKRSTLPYDAETGCYSYDITLVPY